MIPTPIFSKKEITSKLGPFFFCIVHHEFIHYQNNANIWEQSRKKVYFKNKFQNDDYYSNK